MGSDSANGNVQINHQSFIKKNDKTAKFTKWDDEEYHTNDST